MTFRAVLRHRRSGKHNTVEFEARDMAYAQAAIANWLIDRPHWRLVSLTLAGDR